MSAIWLLSGAKRTSAIFSIGPLIVIAISIAGLVFGAEAVQGRAPTPAEDEGAPLETRTQRSARNLVPSG